jgi:soluble P-type ATPase
MIDLTIPGRNIEMHLRYLLIDLNGTLTTGGVLIEGVLPRIKYLSERLEIILLTSDTYGSGKQVADELGIKMITVSGENGGLDKHTFLKALDPKKTVAIGNGYNDRLMLKTAELSIIIIGTEGCCTEALLNSDIAVKNIIDALDLLVNPIRIAATLRS